MMQRSPHVSSSKKRFQDQKTKSRSKSKSLSNSRIENKFYFCHYKNAMYMGGMKSFQKNGKGLILHDNGASSVCNHYNDFKDGHNITYADNCLMSIIYDRNRISQCVFREQHHLLYIKYNKQGQPDGRAILIDFANRSVIYVNYKKGVIVEKRQQKQFAVINRIFDLQNYEFLLGISHSKALRFQIQQNQLIYSQKSGSKFNAGFYRRGLLNGLGITLIIKEPGSNLDTHRNSPSFYLKPQERGYFVNSQLSGVGQKWFKNGNYYFGDFKDNIFEGRGLLKNSAKSNWVYGTFQKGNMSQLIQYSHSGETSKLKKIIEAMHQRKASWINNEITLENPLIFINEMQKIFNHKANAQIKTLQQRKQEVLKKIQENFICDNQNESPLTSSRNIFSYQQLSADDKIQKPQQLNLNNFHVKYNYNSQSNNQQHLQSSRYSQNKNQSIKSPEKNKIQQNPQTVYKIKLLEVPNTKDSTDKKREHSASPSKYESNSASNRLAISQKTMGFSQIKQQSPSFNLDSKRMIGRSRLFKYVPTDQEEQPPKFNYIQAK